MTYPHNNRVNAVIHNYQVLQRMKLTRVTWHFLQGIHSWRDYCCQELLETKVYVSYVICCRSNNHVASRAYRSLENK